MVLPESYKKAVKRHHSKSKSEENPKYRLHDIASRIVLDRRFNTKKEQLAIDEGHYPRVTRCNKTPMINGNKTKHVEGVLLKKSTEFKDHYYFGGLFHCASVWSCPICSAKISQVRAEEVTTAFNIWQEAGKNKNKNYSQLMVSFTIPHYADQSIDDLRIDFMQSRRIMKGQKQLRKNLSFLPYKIIIKKFGIKGCISGIETTYGYNGWHPHSHDIFFLDQDLTANELKEFKSYLTSAWIYACKRSKVKMTKDQEKAMFERSIKISRAKTAEEYISKFGIIDYEKHKNVLNPGWGAGNELTKSHLKRSKGADGFTPWDFLRIIDNFPDDQEIYLKFGRLFKEYVRAFHGKRQLFWSKGFLSYLNTLSELYIIRR